jgi:hypothetical protein
MSVFTPDIDRAADIDGGPVRQPLGDIEIVFDYRVVACTAFMMTHADLGAAKARAVCS